MKAMKSDALWLLAKESGSSPSGENRNTEHYRKLFTGAVKSVSFSLNNVVIKCFTGMASSACVAVDEMFGDMMLGSLAGDDTIIIVTASEPQSAALTAELNKLLK